MPFHDLDLPPADGLTVALDTEASGLFVDDGARVSVVSLAWRDDTGIQIRVLPFDQGDDTPLGRKLDLPRRYPGLSLFDQTAPNLSTDHWRALGTWLQQQLLVYHNSKYDQHIMRAGLRGLPDTAVLLGRRYLWDTMVVAPLLWPNQSVGLKRIAERVWDEAETSAERNAVHWLDLYCGKKDRRYDLMPWQLMEPYAGQDAALTLRLYEYQQAAIASGELPRLLADREVDQAQVLYRMEVRGVGYDLEAAKAADIACASMVSAARAELVQATGISEPTEAKMRFFWFGRKVGPGQWADGQVQPKSFTKDGTPQVTVAVVRGLAERQIRGAAEWARYARLETAHSMWYGTWWRLAGADGRIRTSYWQTKAQDDRRSGNQQRGTVSGRLAVERWQIQAIPHDYQIPDGLPPVRSFLQAKPGHILVEIDMNQAEMRTAAGITKCIGMLEGFERGDDAHSITCRLTFEIDESDGLWARYRNISKRLNFGLIYGAGLDTLVEQIVVYTGIIPARHEVQAWLDAFKDAMPELSRGKYRAKYQAEQAGYVDVPGGKRRHFRFGEPTHKAFNAESKAGWPPA